MAVESSSPDSSEILLIRLGESSPGFPTSEEAVKILVHQTSTSPHKLALLPTRVKPAARAEGGPVVLEADGKALAEALIVRVDARADFAPEMREQWIATGLTESKAWVILKGFRVIDLPLDDVLETADGKAIDRTVGNRQFRWMQRVVPGAPKRAVVPKAVKAPKAPKAAKAAPVEEAEESEASDDSANGEASQE